MPNIFVTGGSGFVGGRLIEALVERGNQVFALARTEASAERVEQRGAISVRGDLDSHETLELRMQGCQFVFHCAAHVSDWGPYAYFEHANLTGTFNALAAARRAGVKRFIHVSTDAVLATRHPLVRVNEEAPYPEKTLGNYGLSKRQAEQAVEAANGAGLETVIMRTRAVWGPGDTVLLPNLRTRILSGQFRWIDQGRALTSTCHVDNVVEGLLLAAQSGIPGSIYFVTDGDPLPIRDFFTGLLETQRLRPVAPSLPFGLALAAAGLTESIWQLLNIRRRPPLTQASILLFGQEVTIDDSKARRELVYTGAVGRRQGLVAMVMSGPAPRYEKDES